MRREAVYGEIRFVLTYIGGLLDLTNIMLLLTLAIGVTVSKGVIYSQSLSFDFKRVDLLPYMGNITPMRYFVPSTEQYFNFGSILIQHPDAFHRHTRALARYAFKALQALQNSYVPFSLEFLYSNHRPWQVLNIDGSLFPLTTTLVAEWLFAFANFVHMRSHEYFHVYRPDTQNFQDIFENMPDLLGELSVPTVVMLLPIGVAIGTLYLLGYFTDSIHLGRRNHAGLLESTASRSDLRTASERQLARLIEKVAVVEEAHDEADLPWNVFLRQLTGLQSQDYSCQTCLGVELLPFRQQKAIQGFSCLPESRFRFEQFDPVTYKLQRYYFNTAGLFNAHDLSALDAIRRSLRQDRLGNRALKILPLVAFVIASLLSVSFVLPGIAAINLSEVLPRALQHICSGEKLYSAIELDMVAECHQLIKPIYQADKCFADKATYLMRSSLGNAACQQVINVMNQAPLKQCFFTIEQLQKGMLNLARPLADGAKVGVLSSFLIEYAATVAILLCVLIMIASLKRHRSAPRQPSRMPVYLGQDSPEKDRRVNEAVKTYHGLSSPKQEQLQKQLITLLGEKDADAILLALNTSAHDLALKPCRVYCGERVLLVLNPSEVTSARGAYLGLFAGRSPQHVVPDYVLQGLLLTSIYKLSQGKSLDVVVARRV